MHQVEQLERTLYGESSTQLGKTYKVIGTIHLLNKNNAEAREYLLKSQAIFEQKGLLKLLKEVKQKLKLLDKSSNMGLTHAQMLMMQGVNNDSEDDGLGDVASPEQLGQIGGRKNKIVVGKKGKKKKVINNYMADK